MAAVNAASSAAATANPATTVAGGTSSTATASSPATTTGPVTVRAGGGTHGASAPVASRKAAYAPRPRTLLSAETANTAPTKRRQQIRTYSTVTPFGQRIGNGHKRRPDRTSCDPDGVFTAHCDYADRCDLSPESPANHHRNRESRFCRFIAVPLRFPAGFRSVSSRPTSAG